jgi:gliding motility-associated protein GldC
MAKKESEIVFKVKLNENLIPEQITWQASDSEKPQVNQCKSTFISLWDEKENNTLRIDLWTKDMMVDEMKKFCVQTLITMADTFERATNEKEIATEMRSFGKSLAQKMDLLNEK